MTGAVAWGHVGFSGARELQRYCITAVGGKAIYGARERSTATLLIILGFGTPGIRIITEFETVCI